MEDAGTWAARSPGAGVGGPCGRDTENRPSGGSRQQFCFKNCTWTRVFVKLFMGPRPVPSPHPQSCSVPPAPRRGFSLNLLTAEGLCASCRGAAGRGYPALGTRPACTPGWSSPSLPEVARGVRASGGIGLPLAFRRGFEYLGLFCRRFIFLDFKASWCFHTRPHCRVPGGRPCAVGQPCARLRRS